MAGRRPAWALPGVGLDGLYDVLGAGLLDGVDPAVLAAAGVRAGLADVLAADGGPDDLLGRLADEDRTVSAATTAPRSGRLLAQVDPDRVSPPARLRIATDLVVPASDVAVVDAPEHLQVLAADRALVVPLGAAEQLAEVLDLDHSSDVVGRTRPVRRHHRRRCPTTSPVSSTACPRPGRSTTS